VVYPLRSTRIRALAVCPNVSLPPFTWIAFVSYGDGGVHYVDDGESDGGVHRVHMFTMAVFTMAYVYMCSQYDGRVHYVRGEYDDGGVRYVDDGERDQFNVHHVRMYRICLLCSITYRRRNSAGACGQRERL
jgi:hypothetical protein